MKITWYIKKKKNYRYFILYQCKIKFVQSIKLNEW